MTSICIREPISWLELERYHLGELGAADVTRIHKHVDACSSCRARLAFIETDAPMLKPLPQVPQKSAWLGLTERPGIFFAWAGAVGVAAIVAVLSFVTRHDSGVPPLRDTASTVLVKGQELSLALVREHDGATANDPGLFVDGDRFKVLVTCPPGAPLPVEVVVIQAARLFFPLARQEGIACGNLVPLPGAFALTGSREAVVCALFGPSLPTRDALEHDGAAIAKETTVCTTVYPAR